MLIVPPLTATVVTDGLRTAQPDVVAAHSHQLAYLISHQRLQQPHAVAKTPLLPYHLHQHGEVIIGAVVIAGTVGVETLDSGGIHNTIPFGGLYDRCFLQGRQGRRAEC